jgi:hypothetical protein
MRYIKFSIIGLIILFILLTSIGLLMPSFVIVGRSVEINAPLDSIRFYTNDPLHWIYWINGADTTNFKQLTKTTTEKNSKIKLDSYTITVVDNDTKYIITSWTSEKGKEQLNRLQLYPKSASSITVDWSFQQQLKWYPWDRLSGMFNDNVLGPLMEVSLNNLKQICEK